MPFATTEDVATRLGRSLDATEAGTAELLITLATGAVQTAARQHIEQVEDDTLTLRGTRESTILLPERPVTEIASVTLDGTVLGADTYWLEGEDTLVRPCGFGCPDDTLVIVYTHGYAETPEIAKAICLEAVVRVMVNPGSLMQDGIGALRRTFAQQDLPPGVLVTDSERQALRRAFGRRASTANLF